MVAVLGSSTDNLLFLYLIYSFDPGRDIQPLQITFATSLNVACTAAAIPVQLVACSLAATRGP